MREGSPLKLEHIEADVKSHIVCSNENRVSILHLLKRTHNGEMQAEKMAFRLGLSHRTVLYHLDILHDYELVEVRKFRKRGNRYLRSVWGLRNTNGHLNKVFSRIGQRYDLEKLDKRIKRNQAHQ
jgi:DNA-binding transcriptional ArsR family regulator